MHDVGELARRLLAHVHQRPNHAQVAFAHSVVGLDGAQRAIVEDGHEETAHMRAQPARRWMDGWMDNKHEWLV